MRKNIRIDYQKKREHWEEHLRGWETSKLTQVEYCRRCGLNIKSFVYWKRRLSAEKTSLSLVEVPSFEMAATSPPPKPLQLEVGSAYRITIERGFDADTLSDLLKVLKG